MTGGTSITDAGKTSAEIATWELIHEQEMTWGLSSGRVDPISQLEQWS